MSKCLICEQSVVELVFIPAYNCNFRNGFYLAPNSKTICPICGGIIERNEYGPVDYAITTIANPVIHQLYEEEWDELTGSRYYMNGQEISERTYNVMLKELRLYVKDNIKSINTTSEKNTL